MMELKQILDQALENKFEQNYEVPDMSFEMQSLTARQKEVADVRTGLYNLVKENFLEEKEQLVYGINDDPVPLEKVKLSPKFWEWHKLGKEIPAKSVDKKDIKIKTIKNYTTPENPRKIVSLVFKEIDNYKTALSSFSSDLERFNSKLDSVVESYTKASNYHTERIEKLLDVKETIKETYEKARDKQEKFKADLENNGYKASYVNQIDFLDLKCNEMNGDIERTEKLLERSSVYHNAFNNLAKAYSSTRSSCRAVTDYVNDIKGTVTTLSNGTLEVDAFVEKVFTALETTMEAEKFASQMLTYNRGISKQALTIGQESYADIENQSNDAKIIESSNRKFTSTIFDKMENIDNIASSVVEKYISK